VRVLPIPQKKKVPPRYASQMLSTRAPISVRRRISRTETGAGSQSLLFRADDNVRHRFYNAGEMIRDYFF